MNLKYKIHVNDFSKTNSMPRLYGNHVPLVSLDIYADDNDSNYIMLGRMLYNPFEVLNVTSAIVIPGDKNMTLNSMYITKLMIYSSKYKSQKNCIDSFNHGNYCYLFSGLSQVESCGIYKFR